MGRLTVIFVFGLTWITIECGFAPALPSGRRTQYYYIYEDGAYKYGYDTGEGSYGKAVASPENEVQGDYAYQGPGGKVDVKYTAGKGGFVPDGFLPSHDGAQSPQYYDSHGSGSDHLAGQWVAAEDEEPGDASYSFSYNVGDQSRQEVSDQQGNIQGSYTYVAKDGSTRKVDYEAGAEKGFLITGITPEAGGSAPSAGISNPDGSYSFSYTAGDHSRHESSDANGNVLGSFSFIAKDDGLNRQVDYTAGAEKGFIATGNHLPQPVEPISGIGGGHLNHAIAANRATFQGVQAPVTHGVIGSHHGARAGGAPTVTAFPSSPYPVRSHTGRAYNAPTGSTVTGTGGALPGRAYEFSYDAGDHTRHESSDANGNVVGSFSFVAKDDNINRKVDYVSSAENGFQAFGAHLPVPPIDTNAVVPTLYTGSQPQFHAAAPQHSHLHIPISAYSGSGISPSTALHGASGAHFSHGTSGAVTKTTHPSSSIYTSSAGGGGVADISDGSYSFSYDAGDHTRQETSDGAGNVIGSFTFVAKDDGIQRKVDYTAGAERGFTASGNHLPLQPDVVAPVIASPSRASSHDSSYHHDTSGDYNPQDDLDSGGPSDASYSFSYNAGDHTRQESSDAFGNVVGSFSFLAKDDGLNRQVDYESGAEKGFVARGSHLPSAFTYSATLPAAGHQYSGVNVHGGAGSSPFQSSHATGHAPAAYLGSAGSSGISNSYSDSKALVKTFLIPNAHHKFGYIYDTK